jgi:MFS family permease
MTNIEGVSLANYGWLLAITEIASLLTLLTFGIYIKRFSSRYVMALVAIIQAIATLAIGTVPSFAAAFIYRLIFGICRAIWLTHDHVMIAQHIPPRLYVFVSAILFCGWGVAGMIGYAVNGLLIDSSDLAASVIAFNSWRLPLYIFGGISLGLGFLLYAALPKYARYQNGRLVRVDGEHIIVDEAPAATPPATPTDVDVHRSLASSSLSLSQLLPIALPIWYVHVSPFPLCYYALHSSSSSSLFIGRPSYLPRLVRVLT